MTTGKLRWRRGERITSWGCEYIAQTVDGWQYRAYPKSANWHVDLERLVDHKVVETIIIGAPAWRLDMTKLTAQRHYERTGGRPS